MNAAAQDQLGIARGAFRIIENRLRERGQSGLTIWTDTGLAALREQAAREAAARERFQAALAALDVPRRATRAELFKAIEQANRAFGGLIDKAGSACLVIVLASAMFASGADEDDDLARRGPQARRGRRRDDVVEICDGETGEVVS